MLDYFRYHFGIKSLGDITWAHAVNSQEKLGSFLNNRDTMFIESDILLGMRGDLIAAHPPSTRSNLTLKELLISLKTSKQGLKLDFKDPEAVYDALDVLASMDLQQPVLLNADILQGPGGKPSRFDPEEFVSSCLEKYPRGILSLGWTTSCDPGHGYTDEQIAYMLDAGKVLTEVTFAVRACLLPSSWNVLQRLIEKDRYSLTIWNNEEVGKELQIWIKTHTDPNKTMYDLLDQDNNQLQVW